jgi:hypothetical protein
MTPPTIKQAKKIGIVSLLGLFLFINVVGVFGVTQTALAQVSVPITDANTGVLVGLGLKQAAKDVAKETKLSFKNALLQSFLSSLVQGASYFTRRLAYDSAKWIASGGKGQGALAFEDGFGDYLKTAASDAGATALEEFGEGFGFSLCSMPDVNLQAFLLVSIPRLYPEDSYGPSPSCTAEQLRNSWGREGRRAWAQSISGQFDEGEDFSRMLQADTQSSDFGIAMGAIANVDRIRAQALEANMLDRIEGQGFRSVTDFISGKILTPSDLIRYEAQSVTNKDQGQLQADQIAGIYGVQALNVIPMAGSVFLNTLVSEGLKNLLARDGLIPQKKPQDITEDGGPTRVRQREIEEAVSFFLKATTPRSREDIDIVATMAACPSDSPSLNNCVMDSGLYTALIRESRNQQRLTIRQAIEEGLMNRNWLLIPPTNALNDDYDCYDGRYCYSNIQKMRKLRILPLGFEIAALRSDPDQPWTLGQVVDNFENCGPRNPDGSVVVDADVYPFCHLIDPNWVLREPVSRCEAEVFGPELVSADANIRREECVDVATCVSFDETGKCEQYGYCTREQNVWEIPGQQCDEQFATCGTFINTQTKKTVSFLTRTLDSDECTSDSVGCRAYSTEKVNGEWVSVDVVRGNGGAEVTGYKQMGRNRTIFFDKDIVGKTCPSDQAGCNAFFLLDKASADAETYSFVQKNNEKVRLNIKKAPEYLRCYDINPSTNAIDWPQTPSDLELLTNDPSCSAYAPACIAQEVGCDGYTPVSGDDTTQIPGIVGNNACNEQCVGYGTYRQLASTFESAKDPLYFVPKDAQTCSLEHVGCSEFTNLDELSRGGEVKAYFSDTAYCEKPVGANRTNEKVFYTWEGSAQSGYVIKTHRLKKVSISDAAILNAILSGSTRTAFADPESPAVPQLSSVEIATHFAACNEESYRDLINGGPNPANADCREFIDESGRRFYRLFGETVRVSDQCSPYRISQPAVVRDSAITTADMCQNVKGLWNAGANSCERCMGGGEYRDGACIYNILASESNSCPASANQCRSYAGNFATNVRTISLSSFEPQTNSATDLLVARGGWSGGSVVAEAVQVGGYSLRQEGGSRIVELSLAPGLVRTDAGRNIVHSLSFWARGESQTLRVEFVQKDVTGGERVVGSFTQNTLASIGDVWRRYEFGPIAFSGNESNTTTVRFTRVNGGDSASYFLDNVRLSRVEDTYALIKDSWKTAEGYDASLMCDTNPTDAFPGEQLGCSAYTQESDNTMVYATGFQNLCREEAIGCRALVDTYNTEAETGVIYNATCFHSRTVPLGAPAEECRTWSSALGNQTCMVSPGSNKCLIKEAKIPNTLFESAMVLASGLSEPLAEAGGAYGLSAIIYPPDTSVNSPVFLSTHNKYSCDGSRYLGCEYVGLETDALPGTNQSTFVTTTIINSPYLYTDTLCMSEEIGCSEYSTSQGLSFFKDPTLIGSLTCQYVEGDGVTQKSGWYLDGIGRCGLPSGDEMDISSSVTSPYCRTNTDCAGVSVGGVQTTCRAVNKTACYPNYLVNDGEYGIFSNSSKQDYKGFVGMCPAVQNGCTEFIDRADTNPLYGGNGRAYYTILDNSARESAAVCGGKASLREGCVLFDDTSNPAKLYDAQATYRESEEASVRLGGDAATGAVSLVSPITSGNRDTNTILKVGRNRECAEWLACRGTTNPFVDSDGRVQSLCYDYDVCNEADGDSCGNFVSNTSTGFVGQYLDQENYISRDTSWYGRDFSGYSLFEKYPVADFSSVILKSYTPTDSRYVQAAQEPLLFYTVPVELLPSALSCVNNDGSIKGDWTGCGNANTGRCISGSCVYPIDGVFPADFSSEIARDYEKLTEQALTNSCKAFPEQSSPFPPTVLIPNREGDLNKLFAAADRSGVSRWVFSGQQNEFANADVCQDGNCSCSYTKVMYESGETDYFSTQSTVVSRIQGYCASGERAGSVCSADEDCGVASSIGRCVPKERVERRMGTLGFCLEYDLSRPINGSQANGLNAPQYACLTWLPLEISASGVDVYNQDILAGYEPQTDAGGFGQVYCTESTDVGVGEYVSEFYYNRGIDGTIDPDNSIDIPTIPSQVASTSLAINHRFNFPVAVANTDGTYTWEAVPVTSSVYLRDIFNDDGSARIVSDGERGFDRSGENWKGDEYDCNPGDAPNDLYRSFLLCNNGRLSDMKKMYTTFLLWSWNYLKPSTQQSSVNATLLRIENYNGTEYEYEYDVDTGRLLAAPVNTYGVFETDGAKKQAFAFAPNVSLDSGVRMHPPRTWSDTPISNTVGVISRGGAFTDLLGPEFSGLHSGSDGAYEVAISPIEREIREQTLSSVYFLPLSYPGGEQGINPALMSKSVMIDFNFLHNASVDGKTDTVPVEVQTGLLQNKDMQRGCTNDNGGGNEDGVVPNGNSGCDTDRPGDRMNFQFGHDTTNDGARWSYVLDRGSATDCGGLLSNCTYGESGFVLNSDYRTYAEQRKNRIQKRYVTVFYSDTNTYKPRFLKRPTESIDLPKNTNEDPFATLCDREGDDGGRNWFAVGMDFNEDGAFLGYISRFCHSGGGGNGIQFAVVAKRYDACTNYAVVHEQFASSDQYNKAWTDRVWSYASETHPTTPNVTGPYGTLQRSIMQKPFGSLAVESSLVSSNTIGNLLYRSVFSSAGVGIPRECTKSRSLEGAFRDLDSSCYGLLFAGIPSNIVYEIGDRTNADAHGSVYNLFALSFKKVYIDLVNDLFSADPRSGGDMDWSGSPQFTTDTEKPEIYSLNPSVCQDGQEGVVCSAADRFAITVNGQNATLRDYNGDGNADEDQTGRLDVVDGSSLIGVGAYQAEVRFFGFADKNHMPIRRVMVRWDESAGGTTPDILGLQKNRKPYCMGPSGTPSAAAGYCLSSTVLKELTCRTDAECKVANGFDPLEFDSSVVSCGTDSTEQSFGNSDRACHEGYFEFQHTYSCDAGDQIYNGLPVSSIESLNPDMHSQLRSSYGLDQSDIVCVYKPAAQIVDNWGWCNASTITKNTKGMVVSATPSMFGAYSGSYPAVVGGGNCDPSKETPWTYFNGFVIVVPEDALPGNR